MIRILLVEDQEIVRRGLRLLLNTQADIEIVGEAGNGQQAINQITTLAAEGQQPDIVLMDIKMPVMDGVEATRAIAQQFPDTKIVVLTTFEDNQFVAQALRYGAKGYLLKDTPLEELTDVIQSIVKGYTQFGPGILEKIIANESTPPTQPTKELPPEFELLTPKEKEVLRLVAQGANNKEIAASLFLSEGTVRNHISNILGRLNVRDRTQAAIIANAFMKYLENNSTTGCS
ncbi:response regulator transcription factor [Vacuolonema iberomarrocanum]|uniref:response regulator transcription factor n=1 Tax=Vacuolonema iberomarrocanum TaxID=3454632 RepID=UPI0019E4ABAF|nr:response regulator transcription factor [filamentous cyanobacterium LEGE 07170]